MFAAPYGGEPFLSRAAVIVSRELSPFPLEQERVLLCQL
jgi:hypothetical protein